MEFKVEQVASADNISCKSSGASKLTIFGIIFKISAEEGLDGKLNDGILLRARISFIDVLKEPRFAAFCTCAYIMQ